MSEKKQAQTQVSGVFKSNGQQVEVSVSVILFREDDTSIAYCPELNVYGYGESESDARNSFDVALSEFFRYVLNKKTLISELEALGWTVKRKKNFIPPVFSTLLEKNPEFREIFNTRNFTKLDTGIATPLPA